MSASEYQKKTMRQHCAFDLGHLHQGSIRRQADNPILDLHSNKIQLMSASEYQKKQQCASIVLLIWGTSTKGPSAVRRIIPSYISIQIKFRDQTLLNSKYLYVCLMQNLSTPNLLPLLIFISLISCLENNNKSSTQESKKPCLNSVKFGDIDLCLPQVNGMKECHSHPLMQNKIKLGKLENTRILGFYLSNNTFKQIDKIDSIAFDNYYTIYSSNNFIGLKIGPNELQQAFAYYTKDILREKWKNLSKLIKKEKGISIDSKPMLVEEYSPTPKIQTGIILMNPSNDRYLITSFNIVQIKDRLIILTHYNNYDGDESIKRTKSENDYFASRLIDENNN